MNYRMTWVDRMGNESVLRIIDTVNESETYTDLTPSSEPFVTSEDSDTDPMSAMRPQTGHLSFITSEPFVITPKSSHHYRVILTVDDNYAWVGWLKAEAYNQILWGKNDEITLNVIDDIEALKTWRIESNDDMGLKTIGELMEEFFENVISIEGNVENLFRQQLTVRSSGNKDIWPSFKVSRVLFFDKTEDEDGVEKYEGKTCYDAIEMVLKPFGLTLRHYGNIFEFTYAGAKKVTEIMPHDTFFGTAMMVYSDITPDNTIEYRGKHQFDIESGYGMVKVVSNIHKIENPIPSLNFDDADIAWINKYEEAKYKKGSTWKTYKWMVRYLTPDGIERKIYDLNGEYTGQITPDNFDDVKTLKGAYIVSSDYWNGPDVDPGSATENENKRNYEFETVVLLRSWNKDQISDGRFLLRATGKDVAIYNNGAISISFSMHCQNTAEVYGSTSDIYGDNVTSPYGILKYGAKQYTTQYANFLTCKLSVGNMWWNGTAWTSTETTFDIDEWPQNVHSFNTEVSNKTLDMNVDSVDYVAMIDKPLHGQVSFTICAAGYKLQSGTVTNAGNFILKDLNVAYCPPISVKTLKSDKDSHSYSETIEGWTEGTKTIELDLISDREDPANFGVLINAYTLDNQMVTNVEDTLNNNQARLETTLLRKMKDHYGRARKMYNLNIGFEYDDFYSKHQYNINGEYYAPIAYNNINWRDCECTAVMEDLPSVVITNGNISGGGINTGDKTGFE